jgi:hypothetical protein
VKNGGTNRSRWVNRREKIHCFRRNRHRLKEEIMKKIIGTIFVMILVSTLVSCLAVGTGGKKIEQQPTLGQELLDLKKAKDEGAISDQEYNEMKEKLKITAKNQNMNLDKVD